MLYWLLYEKLFPFFHPFRIFRYLTFRTAFASLTALLIGLFIGPYVIQKLREFQIGQYIREEGPQSHQKKSGTPTMGGVLIVISIVLPTLLWADLTNPFVWITVLSTVAFGAIGFAAVTLLLSPTVISQRDQLADAFHRKQYGDLREGHALHHAGDYAGLGDRHLYHQA